MPDNKPSPNEVMSFLTYLRGDAWKTKSIAALVPGVALVFVYKAIKGAALTQPELIIVLILMSLPGWLLASHFINKRKQQLFDVEIITCLLGKQQEFEKRLVLLDALLSVDNKEVLSTSMASSLIKSLKGGRGLAYQLEEIKGKVTNMLSNIIRQENDNKVITEALRDQDPAVRYCSSKALSDANVIPKSAEDKAYYYIALERWDSVGKIGSEAKNALVHSLKYSNEPRIRERIIKALSAIGWEPDDPESKLAQYVTNGEWTKVQQMGAIAINPCFALLREENRKNEDSVIKTLSAIAISESISNEDRKRIIQGLIIGLADKGWTFHELIEQALIAIGEPAVPKLVAAYNDVLINLENPDKYPWHYGGGIKTVLVKIGSKAIPYIEKDILGNEYGLLERDEILKQIRKGSSISL